MFSHEQNALYGRHYANLNKVFPFAIAVVLVVWLISSLVSRDVSQVRIPCPVSVSGGRSEIASF